MKTLFLRGGMPKLQASADTVAFDGCAYTGGVMFPTCDDVPAGTPIVVDLDSIVIPSPVRPVLDDHDQSTDGVIGETSQLKVENYTLPVKGVLYPQKPRTKDKILSAKRHRWQLSIGLDNYRVEHIAAGRSVSVNQRVFHGPVAVIRNGYLTDLSFVAVGGDDLTWAKIAAARARRIRAKQLSAGAGIMGFEQWCMDRFGIDAATLTAEQKAKFQALFDAEMADAAEDATEAAALEASKGGSADGETVAAGMTAGRAAASTVQAHSRAGIVEARRVAAIGRIAGDDEDLYTEAVEKDWSIQQTRDAKELKSLRAGRAKPSGIASNPGEHDLSLESDTIQAAILVTSGMGVDRVGKLFAGRQHSERIMNEALSEEYRGMSFQRLFDRSIREAGATPPSNREGKTFLEAARGANRQLKAAGFTTMSISYILENVAQKTLLDGWDSMQSKWKEFCAVRSNVDFKPHSRYALDFTGQFRKVTPKGELQHVSMSDAKYTSQLNTFGAVVTLDRQTYINDDMGAFTARLAELGMLGAQSVEEAVFTLLMSSIGSFFSTTNKNYLSGGSSALSVDSLSLARALFSNMVGPNQKPINVDMQKLLVGTALQTTADTLYRSESIQLASTTAKTPTKNPFFNRFVPIVSPYLNNTAIKAMDDAGNYSAISGQSDTLWFGFAQQGNRSALSVAFLNGSQSPTVESQPSPSIEILGEEYRAYIDYGVATEDYRLAVCSAGA